MLVGFNKMDHLLKGTGTTQNPVKNSNSCPSRKKTLFGSYRIQILNPVDFNQF